ncbi:hypothetical protein AB0G15_17060 [Streptosporangium sp. NPDC023825]|uniref:SH3 domain-containing protein n=1 Tax=Streptosporangium sp. NPDC023825 TaxID=3154909 RepID=UPI0034164DBD
MITKRATATLTALTACATAGGLIWTALPVHAAARLTEATGTPALTCTYRVTNVRSDAVLTIRSHAGESFGPVGTLRAGEKPVAGACASVNGWVQVKTAAGVTGWAPSGKLRKLTSPPAATGRPAPACAYRVTHVRRASFLNVRSGAGLRFRPVAKLRVADGRFAGACKATRGWVKVRAAGGKRGWASAGYLRKVAK